MFFNLQDLGNFHFANLRNLLILVLLILSCSFSNPRKPMKTHENPLKSHLANPLQSHLQTHELGLILKILFLFFFILFILFIFILCNNIILILFFHCRLQCRAQYYHLNTKVNSIHILISFVFPLKFYIFLSLYY